MMGKLKNNQLGFGSVEILLAVLIVAVVGFGGYYVYHTQHKTNASTTASTTAAKTATQALAPATNTDVKGMYTASITKAQDDPTNAGILNVYVELKNTGNSNLTFQTTDFTLVTTSGVVKQFGYNPGVKTNFEYPSNSITLAAKGTGNVIVPFSDTTKSIAKTLVIDSAIGGKVELAVQ